MRLSFQGRFCCALPAAATLLFECAGFAQAAPQATPPPANLAEKFRAQDSNSALAREAAARAAMLSQVGSFPDDHGNGPYPAGYAIAPEGMEDVVYQPEDLGRAQGKLGVYIWGNGGCGYDGASARFHLIEIASHGYIAMVAGESNRVFVADHQGAGHAGRFAEPNGEGTQVELDWLVWQLHHEPIAARTFTGRDCTLCRNYRWTV
jgi:hypothetical protein